MSLPKMPTHSYTSAHMPSPVDRAETVYYHPILMDIYEVENEDTAVIVMLPDSDTMTINTLDTISTFTSYSSGTASAGTSSSQTLPQLQRAMDDMAVSSGCGLAVGSTGGLRKLLGLGLRRTKTTQ